MPFAAVNHKVVSTTVEPGREVLARRGAMLAYTGAVTFAPVHTGSGGIGGMAGRMMAGEQVSMMVAQGQGSVYYGFRGLHVTIIELDGSGPLNVEADRLVAHDAALQSSVVFLGQQGGVRGAIRGAVSGQGLFTTQLSGRGGVALLSHGGTIALPVSGSIGVDPQAYVAHTGALDVKVTTMGAGGMFRDAVGRGSGESVQLRITGTGTVHVQASEQGF
jgi:uncharacterized protein (AIM24 family)